MKKEILCILLGMISQSVFANNFNEEQEKREKDAKTYMSFRYGEPPANILNIAEKTFSKNLNMLFSPKIYDSKEKYSIDKGYLTCFIDNDNNLYSILSNGEKIIKNSVNNYLTNQEQAYLCGNYFKYSKSKNEKVLSDSRFIDEDGLIKYKSDNLYFTETKNKDLVGFILKNREKYKSEIIEVNGLKYLSNITLKGSIDESKTLINLSSYDSDTRKSQFNILNMSSFNLIESCSIKGSAIGKTVFGVKGKYQKQECISISLDFKNPITDIKSDLTLSPDQYRILKKEIDVEIDYTIMHNSSGLTTSVEQYHEIATLTNPYSTNSLNLNLSGEVNEIRIILPITKEKIEIYKKEARF